MYLNDVSFAVFRMFNTEFIRNKIRNKNKNTNKRNANTFLRGNRPANSAKCAFNRAKIVRVCFFFELSIPGGMPDRDCVIFASNLSFALHIQVRFIPLKAHQMVVFGNVVSRCLHPFPAKVVPFNIFFSNYHRPCHQAPGSSSKTLSTSHPALQYFFTIIIRSTEKNDAQP